MNRSRDNILNSLSESIHYLNTRIEEAEQSSLDSENDIDDLQVQLNQCEALYWIIENTLG